MNAELFKLITDFQASVVEGIKLLKEYYRLDKPLLVARRNKLIPKTAIINHKGLIYFNFHGIGCYMQFTNKIVDFDFSYGPAMREDGFDSWRLYSYAISQKGKYPQFEEEKVVQKHLQELIAQGTILQDPHRFGYQYYWSESLNNEQ